MPSGYRNPLNGPNMLFLVGLLAILSARADNAPVRVHTINEAGRIVHELNSHGGATQDSHLEFNYRSFVELTAYQLATKKALYPRIKRTTDGKYVLFYQDERIGRNIYWSRSDDLVRWSRPEKLFAAYPILGGTDERRFTTADAVVLRDGTILAVCSYRANRGFNALLGENGLMMRRSRDEGATWDPEQIIYVGPNWEPGLLVGPTNEVQVYFTQVAPKMALQNTPHSSGVALIRSLDGGNTWKPQVTRHPFAAQRIAQQYRFTTDEGVRVFTDQMPSAIVLNGGTKIAMALESRQQNEKHKISMAYSSDNWSQDLKLDELGPTERVDNMWWGAAPYLRQFGSGETVLAYNHDDLYHLRIGNVEAKEFGPPNVSFYGHGYWGAFEIIGPHTLITTMARTDSPSRSNTIMLGQMHLNHRISAPKLQQGVTLLNWSEPTDALFIGSDSQAQLTLSAAHDESNLLLRLDRLDRAITSEDSEELYVRAPAANDDYVKLELDSSGLKSLSLRKRGKTSTLDPKNSGIVASAKLGRHPTEGTGVVVDVVIPLILIGPYTQLLRLNCILYNRDGTAQPTADTFAGVTVQDQDSWLPVQLIDAKSSERMLPSRRSLDMQ